MTKRLTAQSAARLVDRLYKEGLEVAKRYREIAVVNESFVHGNQWAAITIHNGRSRVQKDAWFDSDNVPRIAVNETAPLLMTWSALMSKDRPTVSAVPANDDPENAYKAAIGNKIIEFLEAELDSTSKVHKAVHFAGMHGTSGLKVCFLGAEDKVSWSRLTLFDFVIDPRNADWRDAGWVIFEDHITEDEALALFEAAKIDREPHTESYKNAAGDELKGVRRLELWHRPSRAYPKGCYVCSVDGEAVEIIEEYPYVFEDDSGRPQYPLPMVLMRVRDVRDSVYGGTNLTDVVPLQRGFNETVSRIQKLIRDLTKVHLMLPDSMQQTYLADNTVIFFPTNQPEAASHIRFTQPAEVSGRLFEQRDFFRTSMQTVMGLNDVTVGSETKSMSGRAIENLVELDEQRNADATKELQAMVRDAWRLTWQLVGRFYTDMRKGKIANAPLEDVVAFNNTDVVGQDIRLESASEHDKLSTARALKVGELAQQGLASPLDLERAKGGPATGLARMHAEQLVAEVLQGMDPELLPDDLNLDVLTEVITKHQARALRARDRATWVRLEQLKRQAQEMAPVADEQAPREQMPA